jgi:putative transposase
MEPGLHLPTEQRSLGVAVPLLVIDVWSRKVVAWDVADGKNLAIAADLVSRACIRERINKGRK